MNYPSRIAEELEEKREIIGIAPLVSAYDSPTPPVAIGFQEGQNIIQQQHETLRTWAVKCSEEIYLAIKNKFEMRTEGMWMRTLGFSEFGALYSLHPDDFYSDKIEELYVFLNEEKKKFGYINWSFVLMPGGAKINQAAMASDGYLPAHVEVS